MRTEGAASQLTNVAFPSIEDYQDIATRNRYRELIEEQGLDRPAAMELVHIAA